MCVCRGGEQLLAPALPTPPWPVLWCARPGVCACAGVLTAARPRPAGPTAAAATRRSTTPAPERRLMHRVQPSAIGNPPKYGAMSRVCWW